MTDWILTAARSLLSLTDEQVMIRVKDQDDEQAFARLVARWNRPIQRLCVRMIDDAHRAEDLTQEVFARVFARRNSYEPTGRFSTFLWRIALNLCRDELRRVKRRAELSLENHDDTISASIEEALHAQARTHALAHAMPAPDDWLVQQERADTVRQALLQLSEPYRVVVVLRHYEGLKFREISHVLDLPEGTVKSRMAQALNQLSALLSPDMKDPFPAEKPPTLAL